MFTRSLVYHDILRLYKFQVFDGGALNQYATSGWPKIVFFDGEKARSKQANTTFVNCKKTEQVVVETGHPFFTS